MQCNVFTFDRKFIHQTKLLNNKIGKYPSFTSDIRFIHFCMLTCWMCFAKEGSITVFCIIFIFWMFEAIIQKHWTISSCWFSIQHPSIHHKCGEKWAIIKWELGTSYHSDINVSLVTGSVVVTWVITSHYFVSQRTKGTSNNRLWMPYKVQGVGFCKVEFRLMDILRCSQLGSTSWMWVDIYYPFKYLTKHNIHTLVHIWVRSFRKGVIR